MEKTNSSPCVRQSSPDVRQALAKRSHGFRQTFGAACPSGVRLGGRLADVQRTSGGRLATQAVRSEFIRPMQTEFKLDKLSFWLDTLSSH